MRFRISVLALFLNLVLGFACIAQNPLSGIWLGKLIQNEEAPFGEYRFRLELTQNGNVVKGISYISMIDSSQIFGRMRLEGIFRDGTFTFHELEVIQAKQLPNWDWCLKTANLKIKQAGEYYRLEGPVEGYVDDFPCKPGRIVLEKLNQQKKGQTPIANTDKNETGDFGNVEGRKVSHRKTVEIYDPALTIYVWDADKVDGDIISLQFNGKWLLRDYAITKTKHEIPIEYVLGAENQLILYAENEGQYPPNTAAITFFDGKQERNLKLSSDKATCGSLKFNLVKQ